MKPYNVGKVKVSRDLSLDFNGKEGWHLVLDDMSFGVQEKCLGILESILWSSTSFELGD
jgi:hypothetical protein